MIKENMNNFETMPLRFRVWDKDRQEFILENADLDEYASLWGGAGVGGEHEIISQDTGLKDKNGKSIYTGDIVKVEYIAGALGPNLGYIEADCETVGIVAYDPLHGICITRNEEEKWWLDEITESTEEDVVILGNIWQSPDLLEEGK